MDYRQEVLLNGKVPINGHISVDQSVKLERLMRDPLITKNDKANKEEGATQQKVREFVDKNPSSEEANNAIELLKQKIAELKSAGKDTK